ncbi:MAG: hypothetical protein KatS3mg001_176 [Candidatus Pacearchaeota archaeon]|nr:MAG: hypothetical protein KatS3mg001_176 [Candidatus Pacearchaeota archaeon]
MEKETIPFSEWQNIDLRVGRIIKVDDIEGADRLYKLTVDLGKEIGKRTLIAGIKQHYTKEQLKGKQCVVFTNLEKKKIKGIESHGMILAAVSKDESKVFLLQPDEEIEEGSRIM